MLLLLLQHCCENVDGTIHPSVHPSTRPASPRCNISRADMQHGHHSELPKQNLHHLDTCKHYNGEHVSVSVTQTLSYKCRPVTKDMVQLIAVQLATHE